MAIVRNQRTHRAENRIHHRHRSDSAPSSRAHLSVRLQPSPSGEGFLFPATPSPSGGGAF